jgi:hypothetical protein
MSSMVGLFHVSQMCDSDAVSREANQRDVRVSCGTIARSPIFMHLPAPILQTLCALCGQRYIPAAARSLKDHSTKHSRRLWPRELYRTHHRDEDPRHSGIHSL